MVGDMPAETTVRANTSDEDGALIDVVANAHCEALTGAPSDAASKALTGAPGDEEVLVDNADM